MVIDMTAFTRSVERHGVMHFLCRIARMRRIAAAAVEAHGGVIVKFAADNAYALFERAREALEAAIAINRGCAEEAAAGGDAIQVCIGIDRGRLLVIEEGTDLYGHCVNVAAKLGEDVARAGEILMTANAFDDIAAEAEVACEEAQFEVSTLAIRGYRIVY
jgi:class 3 adenylate cyclase